MFFWQNDNKKQNKTKHTQNSAPISFVFLKQVDNYENTCNKVAKEMTKEITVYPLNKLVQLKGTPLLQREMALPDWTLNFTKHENQKTAGELYCSAEFTKGVHDELIFLSVLNIFLSIAAVLGNTLILVALHKESSLHSPSKLLYRNLATTDLCVGVIAEPLTVTYWISVVSGRWNICHHTILAVGWSGLLCAQSLYLH